MKLASWNVNGIRAISKKGFENPVGKINADIICFQETKATPEQVKKYGMMGSQQAKSGAKMKKCKTGCK